MGNGASRCTAATAKQLLMLRGRAARVPSYNAVITIPVFAKPIAKQLLMTAKTLLMCRGSEFIGGVRRPRHY